MVCGLRCPTAHLRPTLVTLFLIYLLVMYYADYNEYLKCLWMRCLNNAPYELIRVRVLGTQYTAYGGSMAQLVP